MNKKDVKVGQCVVTTLGGYGDIVKVFDEKVFVQFHMDFFGDEPMEYTMDYFVTVFKKVD